MATLIVEDGSGKTNSNTYVSGEDFDTFLSNRGIALTGNNGDDTEVLIKAKDYLETLCFIGDKWTKDQALQWPRSGVVIDGFGYDTDEIPQQLIDGQMWYAISVDQGYDPMSNQERTVKKEKLDSMEIEYADNASTRTIVTAAESTLQKILCSGNNGISFEVFRS